ncbi:MAG: putative ABC transporter permease [Acutalibacteraceae bacterium]
MGNITVYLIIFFLYSAVGWLVESTYCSIGERRPINRGFLTGPMCPIYGTGALVMTICLYNPFRDKPLMVFLLGMIICDAVEYITSLLMETLFHARWWDYTYEFANIKGRICLKHTLYWGIASIAFVYLVHPFVDSVFTSLNPTYLRYILIVILVIFVLDVVNSFRKALDVRNLLLKLNSTIDSAMSAINTVKSSITNTYINISENVDKQNEKISGAQNEFIGQVEELLAQFELRFSRENKKDKDKRKYSNRLLHNSFNIEKYTRKQIGKLKSIAENYMNNKNDTDGEKNEKG